jgi:hypothetical protein
VLRKCVDLLEEVWEFGRANDAEIQRALALAKPLLTEPAT